MAQMSLGRSIQASGNGLCGSCNDRPRAWHPKFLALSDNLAVPDEPSASGTILFPAVTAYERHLGLGTDGTR